MGSDKNSDKNSEINSEAGKGFVSAIQFYSTKDGPGIRTTVFTVGCNLRCAWCANPELMYPDEKYMYYKQKCIKCGACVEVSDGKVTLHEDGCHIDRTALPDWERLADICPQNAYEIKGEFWTSGELVRKLLRDKEFYTMSKGGVTFSGGEAALQADFVRQTAALLRKEGVHTALDTAGNIPWRRMQPLLSEIDLVLYDIKAMDSSIHKKCTGVDNALILNNAKRIADMGKPMWIRLVIVPGWNDDLNDIRGRFRFVHELGKAVERVDVLKYHSLGVSKYRQLGIDYSIAPGTKCPDDLIREIRRIAKEEKIQIKIDN